MNMDKLNDIAREMDNENILKNVTYVESEGHDVLRIDHGREQSMWLFTDGSIDGSCPKQAKQFLKDKGFRVD